MAQLQEDINLNGKSKEVPTNIDYKMVTFTLGDKDYGIDIMSIREIQKGNRFTYIPNAPDYVRGVYNLRGEIISVVDLRKFFGLPAGPEEETAGNSNAPASDKPEDISITEAETALNKAEIALEALQNAASPSSSEDGEKDLNLTEAEDTKSLASLRLNRAIAMRKKNGRQEEAPNEDILIARMGENTLGIIVDSIDKVVGVDSSTIQKAHPFLADVNIQYISGIVEKEGRLYIILDIQRIFGEHISHEDEEKDETKAVTEEPAATAPQRPENPPPAIAAPAEALPPAATAEKTAEMPVAAEPVPAEEPSPSAAAVTELPREETAAEADPIAAAAAVDTQELRRQIKELTGLSISTFNEAWFEERVAEYNHQLGAQALNLQNREEAEDFLKTFYSRSSAELWDEFLLQELAELLPAKEGLLYLWNVGCGKGYEAYSVTVGVLKHHDKAKVFAQDKDLLKISMAPSLSIEDINEVAPDYRPYMTENGGGWQFNNELKNAIIFEYHDINNPHHFPGLDVIVIRDVISYLSDEERLKVWEEIDKLAGKGVMLILGDNEVLNDDGWERQTASSFSAYKKL
jgi:chemotaxis signal transduction protein/chemotaxis methyl-accepting protein methylase